MVVAVRCTLVRFAEFEGSSRLYVRGSGGIEYLVDLDEYDGNGWCGCQDFAMRRMPRLERGIRNVAQCRCKHIRLARRFFKAYEAYTDLEKNSHQTNLGQESQGDGTLLQAEEAFVRTFCLQNQR